MNRVFRKRAFCSFSLLPTFIKPINLIKSVALAMCVALFFASAVFASATYTENSKTQFDAGTKSNTYIAVSSVALVFNGRTTGVSNPPDSGKWFSDTNWKYRRVVPVSNTSASNLTDYRVALTLDTSNARFNSNGSDLRFTTTTTVGSALSLPYAIESGEGTSSTKVWVKVPYLPASTTTNLYMYYGSSSAIAATSMPSTFLFGDEFYGVDGSSLNSRWSNVVGLGDSGSSRVIYSNELKIAFQTAQSSDYIGVFSAAAFSGGTGGTRYHAKINVKDTDSATKSYFTISPNTPNTNGSHNLQDFIKITVNHGATPTYQVAKRDSGINTSIMAPASITTGGNDFDMLVIGSSLTILLNGTQVAIVASPGFLSGAQYLYVETGIFSSINNPYTFTFDNVFATPCIAQDPSQGSVGVEQGSYLNSGTFISKSFDSGASDTKYYSMDWAVNLPVNTAIKVLGAASNTDVNPSSFTEVSKSTGIAAQGRYFRYKLELSNTEVIYTPALGVFSVTYVSPPLAATNLHVTNVSSDTIAWVWQDNSSGQFQENSVELYLNTARVANLGSNTTQYTSINLTPNDSFDAFVRFVNDAGYSNSTSTTIYTLPAAPKVSCGKDTSTWTSNESYNFAKFNSGLNWGIGGASSYGYKWIKSSTHTFTGSEPRWNSGELVLEPNSGSGEYYLHLKSYNGNGVENPNTATFGPYKYDIDAPFVSLFSPSSTTYWTNGSTTIYVTMEDNGGSGLSSYGWRWTLTDEVPAIYTSSASVSSFIPITVPMTIAASSTGVNGMVYLHVYVQDTAQNQISTFTYPIKLDAIPPDVGLFNINDGATYAEKAIVALHCVVADALSGIDKVYISNEDNNWFDLNWSSATGGDFVYDWQLSTGDGLKTVALRIIDKAGNNVETNDSIDLDSRTQIVWDTATVTASGLTPEEGETYEARANLFSVRSTNPVRFMPVKFTFNGIESIANTNDFGVVTTTFSAPTSSGTAYCYMLFESSNIYGTSDSTAMVIVEQRPIAIVPTNVDTPVNVTFTASIYIMDQKTNTKLNSRLIKFDFLGSTKTATTNSLGVASVTFSAPGTPTQEYYYASFVGDSTYGANVSTGIVTVEKTGTRIEMFDSPAFVRSTFTYTAKLVKAVSGVGIGNSTITFTFTSDYYGNTTKTGVTNSSGSVSVQFCAPNSSGAYTITGNFPGDGDYFAATNNAVMNVLPRQTFLSVIYNNPYVNENFPVTANLIDTTNSENTAIPGQTINFRYNNVQVSSTTNGAGNAIRTFYVTSVISSSCYVNFNGNAQYAKSDSTITITTLKRPVSMSIENIVNVIASSSFTATASLRDLRTNAALTGSNVTFRFEGLSKTVAINSLAEGSTTYWAGYVPRNSTVTVSYAGSSVYENAFGTVTFIINKRPVRVVPIDYYCDTYDPLILSAKLEDQDSGQLIGGGVVNITFGTTTIVATTESDEGSLSFGFAYAEFQGSSVPATYNFYAYSPGSSYYSQSSTAAASVTVYKSRTVFTANPLSVPFNAVFSITGSLIDAKGGEYALPMDNKTVNFNYDGVDVTTTTNANGDATAYFTSISTVGTSKCYMWFPGDSAYLPSNSSATITTREHSSLIIAYPGIAYALDTISVRAKLSDADNPSLFIGTQSVTFNLYVDGSTQTIIQVSDSAGEVFCPFPAISSAGTYGYSAGFAGSTNYFGSTNTSSVQISIRPTKIAGDPVVAVVSSSFTVNVQFTDFIRGNPIADKQLHFNFGNSSKTFTTNGLGLGTAVFFSSNVAGTYYCHVYFSSGDATYDVSETTITISVSLRPATIEAQNIQTPAKSTFTISVALYDYDVSEGSVAVKIPLTNRAITLNVTIPVNGIVTSSSTVTNSSGVAVATFYAGANVGTGWYTAVFLSTGNYEGCTVSKIIEVQRRTAQLIPYPTENAVIRESYTVNAILQDAETTEKIHGATITFVSPYNKLTSSGTSITDLLGVACSTFSATAPIITSTGAYLFSAYFNGDENYLPLVSSQTSNLTINRRPIGLWIDYVQNAYVGRPFDAHMMIYDQLANQVLSTTTIRDQVIFNFNNVISSPTIYQEGVASMTFTAPITTGTYYLNGYYFGNSIYATATDTFAVTVPKRPANIIIPSGQTGVVDSTFSVTANLREPYYGNAGVPGERVDFTFLSSTVSPPTILLSSATTIGSGDASARFSAWPSTGYYNVTAWFAGDTLYQPSSTTTATIFIDRIDTKMDASSFYVSYADSFTATAQLTTSLYGIPISTKTITFDFTFTTSTSAITNSLGWATSYTKFTTIEAGTYSYTATFAGDEKYKPSSITRSIFVRKRDVYFVTTPVVGSPYVNDDAYVGNDPEGSIPQYIKLKDQITDQFLSIESFGLSLIHLTYKPDEAESYSPPTDIMLDGIYLKAVISGGWPVEGYHSVKMVFDGNAYFNSASKELYASANNGVYVKPKDTEIFITVGSDNKITGYAGAPFNPVAQLLDKTGGHIPMADQQLVFYLYTSSLTPNVVVSSGIGTTDEFGFAISTFTANKVGDYYAQVVFEGAPPPPLRAYGSSSAIVPVSIQILATTLTPCRYVSGGDESTIRTLGSAANDSSREFTLNVRLRIDDGLGADGKGTILPGRTISSFTFNGDFLTSQVSIPVVTNSSGVASATFRVPTFISSTYTYTAIFLSSGGYQVSYATGLVHVVKNSMAITATKYTDFSTYKFAGNTNEGLSATLYRVEQRDTEPGSDNRVMPLQPISFTVPWSTGAYTETYAVSSNTIILNGSITNGSGVSTTSYITSWTTAPYTYTASFAGSAYCDPQSDSGGVFTVRNRTTSTSIYPLAAVYIYSPFLVSAGLTDADNVPAVGIAASSVTFKVWDIPTSTVLQSSTVLTDASGNASVTFDALTSTAPNKYRCTAYFYGKTSYYASSSTQPIVVNKRKTSIVLVTPTQRPFVGVAFNPDAHLYDTTPGVVTAGINNKTLLFTYNGISHSTITYTDSDVIDGYGKIDSSIYVASEQFVGHSPKDTSKDYTVFFDGINDIYESCTKTGAVTSKGITTDIIFTSNSVRVLPGAQYPASGKIKNTVFDTYLGAGKVVSYRFGFYDGSNNWIAVSSAIYSVITSTTIDYGEGGVFSYTTFEAPTSTGPGNFTLWADWFGDTTTYNSDSSSMDVIVDLSSTQINGSDIDTRIGENFTFSAQLTGSPVAYYIYNKPLVFELWDSSHSYMFSSATATTHDDSVYGTCVAHALFTPGLTTTATLKMDVYFNRDGSDPSSFGSAGHFNVNVLKRPTFVLAPDITVKVDRTFIATATINDTLSTNKILVDGDVAFEILDTSYVLQSSTVVQSLFGDSHAPLVVTSAVNYILKVTFDPNEHNIRNLTAFTTATIRSEKNLATIVAAPITAMALENFDAYASLIDSNTMSGIVLSPVTFSLQQNGQTISSSTVLTDDSGIAHANIDAPARWGDYVMRMDFAGDRVYYTTSAFCNVLITSRPVSMWASDVSGEAWGLITSTAGIYDNAGALSGFGISGATLTFTLYGDVSTTSVHTSTVAYSNSLGTATAHMILESVWKSSGTYLMKVIFNGNETYQAASSTCIVTLNRRGSGISAADISGVLARSTFSVIAVLVDTGTYQPRFVSGQTVLFTLYSSTGAAPITASAVTNSTGVATGVFNAWAASGTYCIDAVFPDNYTYYGSQSSCTVTLLPRQLAISTYTLITTIDTMFTTSATLRDFQHPDWLVSDASVTFTLTQSTSSTIISSSVVSGADGVAMAQFTSWMASGTYNMVIEVAPSVLYEFASATATVNFMRRVTKISLGSMTVVGIDQFNPYATLIDSFTGTGVDSKELYFVLYDSSNQKVSLVAQVGVDTATTDGYGVAIATLTAPNRAQTCYLFVSFGENDPSYQSTISSAAIYIARRPNTMWASDVSGEAWGIITSIAGIYDGTNTLSGFGIGGSTLTFTIYGSTSFGVYTSTIAYADSLGTATANILLNDNWKSSGTYPALVSFNGNEIYLPSSATFNVYLSTRNVALYSTDITTMVSSRFIAAATLADIGIYQPRYAAGKMLNFVFYGLNGASTTANATTNSIGIATTSFASWPLSGTYQLQVSFAGDATYPPISSSSTITLAQRPISIVANSVTTTVSEMFVATATLYDKYDGWKVEGTSATFTLWNVGGSSVIVPGFAVSDSSGQVFTNIAAWASSGTYTLEVNSIQSATHDPGVAITSITINRRQTSLTSNDVNAVVFETFTITANLFDNFIIPPRVIVSTKTIQFCLYNPQGVFITTVPAVTDTVGEYFATATIYGSNIQSAGRYSALILFDADYSNPDPIYSSTNTYITIIVDTRPATISISDVYNVAWNTFTVSANVFDNYPPSSRYGSAVDGGTATFKFWNAAHTDFRMSSTTVLQSTASVVINAWEGSGDYQLDVTFLGNPAYISTNTICTVHLSTRNYALSTSDINECTLNNFISTATFNDLGPNARIASGRQLRFVFEGVANSTNTAFTNDVGIATTTFNAWPARGTYTLHIEFDGDATYPASSTSCIVTLNRRPVIIELVPIEPQLDELFIATASLHDQFTGNPAAIGSSITFVLWGSTYAAVGISSRTALGIIDGTGYAQNYEDLMSWASTGTYLLGAIFEGNETYSVASSSILVRLARRSTRLQTYPIENVMALETFIASATLSDQRDILKPIPGRDIIFNIVDIYGTVLSTSTGTTYDNNMATAVISALPESGVYTLRAIFPNTDSMYIQSSASETVHITTRPAYITLSDVSTMALSTFSANASLRDSLNPAIIISTRTVTFTFYQSTSSYFVSLSTQSDVLTGSATVVFTGWPYRGSYNLDSVFDGDFTYSPATAASIVTLYGRPSTMTILSANVLVLDTFSVTAQITDLLNGALVSGSTATFVYHYDLLASSNTDVYLNSNVENGVAISTFSARASSGVYVSEAYFNGNLTYEAINSTGIVNVTRRPLKITLDGTNPSPAVVLSTFVVSATVIDLYNSNNSLNGRVLNFALYADTSTSLIAFSTASAVVNGGVASVIFMAPADSGTYAVGFEYKDGDATYLPTVVYSTFTVAVRPTRMTANQYIVGTKGHPVTFNGNYLFDVKVGTGLANVPVDWYLYKLGSDSEVLDSGRVLSSTWGTIGEVVFVATGPAPGNYLWKIAFEGDSTYGASFATAPLTMGLLTVLITEDVNTYTMKEFRARARLVCPEQGIGLYNKLINFEFRVSSTQVVRSSAITSGGDANSRGYAEVTFTAPASSGTFNYYASFPPGDPLYVDADSTATVVVNPRSTSLNANAVSNVLVESSFSIRAELRDTIGNVAIASKTLTFIFNGSTRSATTDAGGIATAQFFSGFLSSGTYTYYVEFSTPTEHTYAPSSSTANVEIRRHNITVIAYPVSNIVANSTFTATAQLLDIDIGGLGVVGETVVFDFTELGGSTIAVITNGSGIANRTFVAPSTAAVYNYSATYENKSWKYTGAYSSNTVTVGKRTSVIFAPNISQKAGMGFDIDITLKDALEGYGIEGRTITVTYNFITSTVIAITQTDASGVARFSYDVPAATGVYIYSAVFDTPDATYNPSMSSGTITVANEVTTLEIEGLGIITKIKENFNASAVLQHSSYRLEGASVSFVFEGITQIAVTDSFGRATVAFATLGLVSTGTYPISAFYEGDTSYMASTDIDTVTAVTRDTILLADDIYVFRGEVFTAIGVLKDNVNGSTLLGDKIFDVPVEFTLHDPNNTDQVNTASMDPITGDARALFEAPMVTGTYNCSLAFYGTDTYYSPSYTQCNVYVLVKEGDLADTALRAQPVFTYISTAPTTISLFTASATLTTQSIAITGRDIEFSFFNGVSTQNALGVTDDYGLATATFTVPVSIGNYNFMASFIATGMFRGSTDSAHVDVSSRPASMVATDVAPDPSSVFNGKVTLTDILNAQTIAGLGVTFTFFDGVSTSVVVATSDNLGVAIASFTAPIQPGTYFYMASFSGNGIYSAVSATGSVLVALQGTDTFLVLNDVTTGILETFTATATLTAAGSPIANRTVEFHFEGTIIRAQTSNSGVANVTFTAPMSSNTYNIYGVFAGDLQFKMSEDSATVKVLWREFLVDPSPLKLSYTGGNVTIEWPQLEKDLNKIKGYWVEKTSQLNGTWSKTDFFYTTAPALAYTTAIVSNSAMYYRVKSIAFDDQESKGLVIAEVPAEGQQSVENSNNIYMSEDFSAWVTIPNKYMAGLYEYSNSTVPLRIVLEKKTEAGFLLTYEFYATDEYGNKVDGFDFSTCKNGVLVTLSYAELIGSGSLSAALVSNNSGKQIGLFFYNGVEWVKLGGVTDTLNNKCYMYTQKLGLYGLMLTTLAQEFTLNKVAPRIFTPEESSDIINRVRFYFENPDGDEVTIRIYDITGALVKRNVEKEADAIMYWDGTDIDGNFVKTGIYIYQIEAGKKVKNGTIVVAK